MSKFKMSNETKFCMKWCPGFPKSICTSTSVQFFDLSFAPQNAKRYVSNKPKSGATRAQKAKTKANTQFGYDKQKNEILRVIKCSHLSIDGVLRADTVVAAPVEVGLKELVRVSSVGSPRYPQSTSIIRSELNCNNSSSTKFGKQLYQQRIKLQLFNKQKSEMPSLLGWTMEVIQTV